jgi:hypothetical protein
MCVAQLAKLMHWHAACRGDQCFAVRSMLSNRPPKLAQCYKRACCYETRIQILGWGTRASTNCKNLCKQHKGNKVEFNQFLINRRSAGRGTAGTDSGSFPRCRGCHSSIQIPCHRVQQGSWLASCRLASTDGPRHQALSLHPCCSACCTVPLATTSCCCTPGGRRHQRESRSTCNHMRVWGLAG